MTSPLRFTKMHGIGNDYVYVDLFRETVGDAPALARRVSDRHFGVGSDGLILVAPPRDEENDCRMEMYNADGSRAEMCGNGLRCVAKFAFDRGIVTREVLRVETDAGTKEVRLAVGRRGEVERVTVDMGAPGLRRCDVPVEDGGDPSEPAVDIPIRVAGREFRFTAVSTGNPHAVVRIDAPPHDTRRAIDELPLESWGPLFEEHEWFPERTNTEFVAPRSRTELDFRVWERGTGETLACGTGACAAVVAAVLNDWCERRVTVHLRGGDLDIEWGLPEEGGHLRMTGPATEVFEGELLPN